MIYRLTVKYSNEKLYGKVAKVVQLAVCLSKVALCTNDHNLRCAC